MRDPPARLRGHHFLCLCGFRGLGYSHDFVTNMAAVLEAMRQDSGRLVEVVEAPDDICRACPHLQDGACVKKGKGSEARVAEHDRRVLRLLGIKSGEVLPAGQVFRRIRERILPRDVPRLCEGCEWLPLGYCQEGLGGRGLLSAHPQQIDIRAAK